MPVKLKTYAAADYLQSEEDVQAYLEAALEENDPAFFQEALGTVARAHGMQALAERSNATRAGLYKALSTEGNPEFATVFRVVTALGYRFALRPETPKRKARSVRKKTPR